MSIYENLTVSGATDVSLQKPINPRTTEPGSMLTGSAIRNAIADGTICISDFDPKRINPNSYNVRLDPRLRIYSYTQNFAKVPYAMTYSMEDASLIASDDDYEYYRTKNELRPPLDMHSNNPTQDIIIPETGLTLYPGVLYLGCTVESTGSDHYIPMLEGRSSGGRHGLSIHVTAGFGDVGVAGTWTLEITVVEPLTIYPYDEIGQVCFHTVHGDIDQLYRGKYYKQEGPTASKFHLDEYIDKNHPEWGGHAPCPKFTRIENTD